MATPSQHPPSAKPTKGIWQNAEPTWRTKGRDQDKVAAFGWQTLDEPGELNWIDKGELSVDHELYQREVDNPAKVNKIAAEWSWMACGALIVALRQNGTYWVVDGQNRLVAALKRSDIAKLPCLLFPVASQTEEASAFIRINRNRRSLARVEMFKADITRGDLESLELAALLKRFKYEVGQPGAKRRVQCVDALLRAMRSDKVALEKILQLHHEVLDAPRVNREMVEGMMHLVENGVDVTSSGIRKRLSTVGLDECMKSIRDTVHFHGKHSHEAYAQGIARALNKGLRNLVVNIDE